MNQQVLNSLNFTSINKENSDDKCNSPELGKDELFAASPKLYFVLTEKKLFSPRIRDQVVSSLYAELFRLFHVDCDRLRLVVPKKSRLAILMASLTFTNFKKFETGAHFNWKNGQSQPANPTKPLLQKISLKSKSNVLLMSKEKNEKPEKVGVEHLTNPKMKSSLSCLKRSFTLISKDKSMGKESKQKGAVSTESSLVAETNLESDPHSQTRQTQNEPQLRTSFDKPRSSLESFDRFKLKMIEYISQEFKSVYNVKFLEQLFAQIKNKVLGSFGESLFAQLVGEPRFFSF